MNIGLKDSSDPGSGSGLPVDDDDDRVDNGDEPREGAVDVGSRRPQGTPAGVQKINPSHPSSSHETAPTPSGATSWRWPAAQTWRTPSPSSPGVVSAASASSPVLGQLQTSPSDSPQPPAQSSHSKVGLRSSP
ncbi:hypothetical protein HPP92_002413 [Vanilla planifolia]|uniref:Uncharacterized protein n=1 Tax=Vanilla planifolia TaxID=51239 RepID=A0A835VG99_VANPL|nr:hypothetical protein HPP92_002413 [Vanilla planifolia]